jgi:hypothetical protein
VWSSPTVVDGTAFVGAGTAVHALETGTDGSSNGSRVLWGTLGHHDAWTGDPTAVDVDAGNDDGETNSSGGGDRPTDANATEDGSDDDSTRNGRGTRPWSSPGVLGAVAGFVGASYLLKRQLDRGE